METAARAEDANLEDCGDGAPCILVVDDVAVNREILMRRLVRQGFSVTEATGGQEAIRIVEQRPIDLILLDIMMPDLDGTEVVRVIRRTRSKSDLPIVMVSAKCFSNDVEQSLAVGANAYITKPVDFPRLLAVIDEQTSAKRSAETPAVAG